MQTDSYHNAYPTSIRISRDLSSSSHDQDLVDHESLSTLTLTEDSNLAEIAPWALNGSEPVRIYYSTVFDFVRCRRLAHGLQRDVVHTRMRWESQVLGLCMSLSKLHSLHPHTLPWALQSVTFSPSVQFTGD